MDPALQELIESTSEGQEVEAVLKLRDERYPPPGVRIVCQFGEIATCRIRHEAIRDTWAHESVASLKAPRFLTWDPPPELPEQSEGVIESREDPEANALRGRRNVTGRNVVVAVLDWGCDFAHPNFRNKDGSTRLLALWDQSAKSISHSNNRYGYGVIHTRKTINKALRADDPYVALGYHPAKSDFSRTGTHGAHVLDIAAGNGRVPGAPLGVAPAADLLFVHLAAKGTSGLADLGDSVRLLEALDFVARTAGNRPWVANLSLGRTGGKHTGESLVEQGMDALLLATPGCALCQSTGNYFHTNTHASGRLLPNRERTLGWYIDPADLTPNELEVWYHSTDTFAVRISPPNKDEAFEVALGEHRSIVVNGQEVGRLYHRAYDRPKLTDHHIDCFLYKDAPAGRWEVTLTGVDVVDGRFHAWIERDAGRPHSQSRFDKTDARSHHTIGTICNGYRTISVGAYDPRTLDRDLAPFSSRGPTRDGRLKPDILAPGVKILAARSNPRDAPPGIGLLTRKSGTSMATPHVTGSVALLFEAAPRKLSIAETRAIVLGNTDSAQGKDPLRSGNGYLNIDKVIHAAGMVTGEKPGIVGEDTPAVMEESYVRVFAMPVINVGSLDKRETSNREERYADSEMQQDASDAVHQNADATVSAESVQEPVREFDDIDEMTKETLMFRENEGLSVEESIGEGALAEDEPVESEKKRNLILISGGPGPYDNRDVEHDQSWANYVTPPLLMTDTREKLKKFVQKDEEVWWFVYKLAYERRWKEDLKDPDRKGAIEDVKDKGFKSYVDMIEGRAKERGWNLRWLSEADDLWKKLKTFRDPISRVWYWGHARHDLWLSLRHNTDGDAIAPEPDEIITVDSIKRNRKLRDRFQAGDPERIHRFVGCNTDKFAQAWSKTFKVWSAGVEKKIDFSAIHKTGGQPTLVDDAKIKFFSPKGNEAEPTEAWQEVIATSVEYPLTEEYDDELREQDDYGAAETRDLLEYEDDEAMDDVASDEWFEVDEAQEQLETSDLLESEEHAAPDEWFEENDDDEDFDAYDLFEYEDSETSDDETTPYVETFEPSLVELADEAISAGVISRASGALLGDVLPRPDIEAMLSPFDGASSDSPPLATIFEAFAADRLPAYQRHLDRFFEVVARPGEQITQAIESGDLLVRRGEGGLAHLAMIVDGMARRVEELESEGLRAECGRNGLHVRVIEAGPVPHAEQDGYARRLAAEDGRLDLDSLILRHRPEAIGVLGETLPYQDTEEEELGLPFTDEEDLAQAKTVKEPLAVPVSDPVPFAQPPPQGSYWPVVTSHPRGREVNYKAADGSTIGSRLRRRFLANRSQGRRYHVGVDLFGNFGDPVVACEAGTILSFYPFCCGSNKTTWALFVEHNNLVINYGEVAPDSLQRAGLRKGSQVTAGQIIGYVGRNPGGSTMIHFETYAKGTKTNKQWKKGRKRPPALLNPTKYLLFLQEHGLSGSETGKQLGHSIFSALGSLAQQIQDALQGGLWSLAIGLAIQAGRRDENELTNMVFFARHPERGGRKIEKGEPNFKQLSKEWLDIRNRLVRPALTQAKSPDIGRAIRQGLRDENKLTNMIFFARHPERGGRKIEKGEPDFKRLSKEWLHIRDRLVRPALAKGPTPPPPLPALTSAEQVELDRLSSTAQAQFWQLRSTIGTYTGVARREADRGSRVLLRQGYYRLLNQLLPEVLRLTQITSLPSGWGISVARPLLVGNVLYNLAFPETINQGGTDRLGGRPDPTCFSASTQMLLARRFPTTYVRLTIQLATTSRATLAGGDSVGPLTFVSTSLYKSLESVLLQTAFDHYFNTTAITGSYVPGDELKVHRQVFGPDRPPRFATYRSRSSRVAAFRRAFVTDGGNTRTWEIINLCVGNPASGCTGNHTVVLTRVHAGRVYFYNPWANEEERNMMWGSASVSTSGKGERPAESSMSQTDFENQLTTVFHN